MNVGEKAVNAKAWWHLSLDGWAVLAALLAALLVRVGVFKHIPW
ncbi:MAG: hypothetical protein WBG02_16010 [Candidatus Acidiferrum sp.]